jgi:signal transduction histidine kinase/FixJ family two-component response regulator
VPDTSVFNGDGPDPMTEDELPGYNEIAFLQEAIDCLPNGFAILNAEFLPLHVNRAALEAFPAYYHGVERGLSYREATFESVRTTWPAASEEECWQITDMREALLTSGKPADVTTGDGRIFNIVYRPMSGNRYVAIYVDVTAQRQMSKELEVARYRTESVQRANSTFLANLSHEIRTPLNGILGMAQEVERGGLTDEEQCEHGQTIVTSARSLKTLFDDVIDLAKIEAGQMTLAPADEDLEHLLAQQLRRWRPLAEEKFLTFSLDVAEDLPRHLRFDPVRLGQCVSNLLGNAVKFTERGGVAISASRYDHADGIGVRIEVSDTGMGMSPDKVDKLFVPFMHKESAFSRRFGGTGLGVVLTQKLARLMGGDLKVTSEPGKGSVLTLTIVANTVRDRTASTAIAKDEARDKGAARFALSPRKRILLVDDHPLNRRVGRLYLEPEGFIVSEAVNGQQALDCLAQEQFDLVLMDIHMPVMDGLEALRQIRGGREDWRDVPVIAFTADAMSGDRERYVAEGMNGYIPKPIEKRDLLAEIGRILGLPMDETEDRRAAMRNPSLAAREASMSMR